MSSLSPSRRVALCSAVGFGIPFPILGIWWGVRFLMSHPLDREYDLERLPMLLLLPSCGCAFVFFLAAIATATQHPRIDFLRSLLITASVVGLARIAVSPSPRTKLLESNQLTEFVIPMVAGLFACAILTVINRLGVSGMQARENQ